MNESAEETRERLEQEAVAWHSRLTSGETEAAERACFDAWRDQSPAHAKAYRKIEKLWQLLDDSLLKTEYQRRQNSAANHILANTPAPLNRTRRYRTKASLSQHPSRLHHWSIGLATAAILLLALTLKLYPDYLQAPWAGYRTHIGEQASAKLADGSTVYLNTDTALDVTLDEHERRVVLLKGEAEFEVAYDKNRPFRVKAGNTSTEALDTHFIIRYNGDSGMVTLLEGKVRTTRISAQGEFISARDLHPGEFVAFNPYMLGELEAADLTAANAWRSGRLIMNFVPLQQVIVEINRYRRGQVKLINHELANREINVAIDINHIDAWLDALKDSLPLHIHRVGPFVLLNS